jgi:hypothetical protein
MAATKNKSDSTEKSQKDESTRKSAAADNRRTGRVSSTRTKKASSKKSGSSRKSSSKKSSSKQTAGKTTVSSPRAQDKSNVPVNSHPFPPDAKVEVYRASDVDVQRRRNRAPVGEAVTSVTVPKSGDLTIQRSKLEPGQYVAVAKLDKDAPGATNRTADKDEDFYAYVGFGVVTDEQRDKFGSMTGLFGGKKS